jgi:rod shape determining protein RodA
MSIFRKLQRLDWLLLGLVLALCVYSVILINSATFTSESPQYRNAYRAQIFWVGLGLAGFFTLALLDYNFLVRLALPLSAAALVLLVAVLFTKPVNGARSWFGFGGFGIQPAEGAKLVFALFLAYFFVVYEQRVRSFKIFIGLAALTFVPVALILKQPDLGSAMVFFPMAGSAMLVAGVRRRYLLIPVAIITGVILFTYFGVYKNDWKIKGLKQYQLDRIKTFYDPNLDPLGTGWNVNQSLIAVGSGGLHGKGYKQGTQNVLGFLPKNVSYNDFIFSVACEEWGFLGGTFIISLEGLIILYCLYFAYEAKDLSGRLLCTAVAAMLFTHLFVNAGMTINVVPITGIPLPFISYGGTFLMVCLASLGLVQSVWIHRRVND